MNAGNVAAVATNGFLIPSLSRNVLNAIKSGFCSDFRMYSLQDDHRSCGQARESSTLWAAFVAMPFPVERIFQYTTSAHASR